MRRNSCRMSERQGNLWSSNSLLPRVLFRFMWFCLTTIGTIVTLIIIVSLWDKFQTNPTITGLDTDFHSWNVPFPTVSLCSQDLTDDSLVSSYVKECVTSDCSQSSFYTGFPITNRGGGVRVRSKSKSKGAPIITFERLRVLKRASTRFVEVI